MNVKDLARGIIVPTITVFDGDLVDIPSTQAHVESLVENGVHGIVVGGSSGEFLAVSSIDIGPLFRGVVEAVDSRVSVYAMTGRYSTAETIALSKRALAGGVDGLMILPPYYYRPSNVEAVNHFTTIRKVLGPDVPIILYNNPGTCGIEISSREILSMYDLGVIQGVKSSQGTAFNSVDLRCRGSREGQQRITSYYGHDFDARSALRQGVDGWLSGILNVFSELAVIAWKVTQEKNFRLLSELCMTMQPLADFIWLDRKVHPLAAYKAALTILGSKVGDPAPPIMPLNTSEMKYLEGILTRAYEPK